MPGEQPNTAGRLCHTPQIDDVLTLALFDGDGIGPEVVQAVSTVLDQVLAAADIAWRPTEEEIGLRGLETSGTSFSDAAFAIASQADGVILGPVSHLDYPDTASGGVNPSAALRRSLDLYANIRPARTYPGVPHPGRGPFDLVIVRENTEGFYADRTMHQGSGELMPTPDLALSYRKVTREGSLRIARRAFELATARRRHVTVVHKANVLTVTDGLFLECTREVAHEYPDVEYQEELVDAVAAHLIRQPDQFDVIVTTNMFGDILSDEATELSGSIGLAASLNEGNRHAMAQAQHGSAPLLTGTDQANPTSLISSTAMLLDWLAERRNDRRLAVAATAIDKAIETLVSTPATRTADLGGDLGTREFTEHVARTAQEHLASG